MRKRTKSHDYSKPVHPVAVEVEEEQVEEAPKQKRQFTWYVSYSLPEIALTPEETPAGMDPSVQIRYFEDTVVASDEKLALHVFKSMKQPAAEHIAIRPAIIACYWRKKGTKDKWYLTSHTDGTKDIDHEAHMLDLHVKWGTEKPALLRTQEDPRYPKWEDFWTPEFVPEFLYKEYKDLKGLYDETDTFPEWLSATEKP